MKTRVPRKKKKQIKTFIRKNRKWYNPRDKITIHPEEFCCRPITPSEAFLVIESQKFPLEEL